MHCFFCELQRNFLFRWFIKKETNMEAASIYVTIFFSFWLLFWRAVDINMNYVRIVWDSVKWVAANWSLNVCMQMYEMCGTACSLYLFVCHKNHTKSVTWNVWYFFRYFSESIDPLIRYELWFHNLNDLWNSHASSWVLVRSKRQIVDFDRI